MAGNSFEYDLLVNSRQAMGELAKFTKAQEQTVQRIKKAQEEQVKSNVKVDRSIISTRTELSKQRAALVRYSKNLTKNGAKAAEAADKVKIFSLQLNEQTQELREGKRALTEYGKQLDKLQRDAAKGIDLKQKVSPGISQSRVPLGPGLASAEGRRAGFARRAKNIGARSSAGFNAASAAAGSGGLLAPLASGLAIQRSVSGAVDLDSQRTKLRVLSEQYGDYNSILKIVENSASTFNKSQREATTEFANVYARLRPLGVELDDIKGVYEGFNAVAIASGATSESTRIAFMQLSQAIGSGRLAGDEFRSVSEQIPGVLIPIAKEMGVTVGELKNLGSEGKITSDVLIRSLSGSFALNKEKIKQLLAEQPAAKFKAFANAVSDLADAVGDSLLPLILPLIELLTRVLKTMLRLPNPVKAVGGALIGLGLAFHAAAAGAAAFGKTLTASAVVGFMAMAAKIALIAGPLVGLAMVMEENIRKKQEFDEALASDEPEIMKDKIEELGEAQSSLKKQLSSSEKLPFYRGQAGDIDDLKGRIKDLQGEIEELTKRRQLIIDIVTKVHTVGGIDYKMDGPGGRLVPVNAPETVSERIEREAKETAERLKNKGKSGGKDIAGQLRRTDANNELRLTQKNAQIALKVARDEYALRSELEQSNHRLQESNLVGVARQQQAIINARIQAFRGLEVREQRLEDEVTKAEQRLAAAEQRLTQATGPVDAARAAGTVSNAQADLSGAQQKLGNFQSASSTMDANLSQAMSAKSTEAFRQQTNQALIQVGALRQRNELLAKGVSPEVLQGEMAKFEIDRQRAVTLQQLNANQLDNAQTIRDIKLAAEEAKGAIDQLTIAQQEGSNSIREYINTSMNFVSDIQGRIVDIASTIEQSIGTAIQGVVDGTLTASQAFGQFFANVGKSFLAMAAQIIAKLIIIKLLKSALSMFGSSSFGGGSEVGQMVDMPSAVNMGAGNGIIQNGAGQGFGTFGPNFGIRQFAKGGIVTGPTTALIGEGGMNEAVVPLPNGKAIPVDMRGATGAGDVTSNVTVNITNDGDSSDSDPNGPAKLGRAIDTAVRKVIMDERRSGGLLYSAR